MQKAGVPVVPGGEGVLNGPEEALLKANQMGYPVMLKASAGGGGRGMRFVKDESEVISAFKSANQEALTAFGNGDIYIEKFIENPRHIEVQILGDSFGNVIHLGERECSIQRRHQKTYRRITFPIGWILSLVIKSERLLLKGAKAVKYIGVGTIEFLMDKDKNFYFMEMNTRIQVEHPVTEMVTGVDLIKQQILMHAGEKISEPSNLKLTGHSIECGINAEDPSNNFLPFPGKINSFHMPGGKGVRVDSHAYSGYEIPRYYDSMIGKIIVHAKNRDSGYS